MSKWKLSEAQLKALSEVIMDGSGPFHIYTHKFVEIIEGCGFEEVVEPLKKGDKIQMEDGRFGYVRANLPEGIYVRLLDNSCTSRSSGIVPYEWTEEDLRKQFEEATK